MDRGPQGSPHFHARQRGAEAVVRAVAEAEVYCCRWCVESLCTNNVIIAVRTTIAAAPVTLTRRRARSGARPGPHCRTGRSLRDLTAAVVLVRQHGQSSGSGVVAPVRVAHLAVADQMVQVVLQRRPDVGSEALPTE